MTTHIFLKRVRILLFEMTNRAVNKLKNFVYGEALFALFWILTVNSLSTVTSKHFINTATGRRKSQYYQIPLLTLKELFRCGDFFLKTFRIDILVKRTFKVINSKNYGLTLNGAWEHLIFRYRCRGENPLSNNIRNGFLPQIFRLIVVFPSRTLIVAQHHPPYSPEVDNL